MAANHRRPPYKTQTLTSRNIVTQEVDLVLDVNGQLIKMERVPPGGRVDEGSASASVRAHDLNRENHIVLIRGEEEGDEEQNGGVVHYPSATTSSSGGGGGALNYQMNQGSHSTEQEASLIENPPGPSGTLNYSLRIVDNNVICSLCGTILEVAEDIENHQFKCKSLREPRVKYHCTYCGWDSSLKEELENHLRLVHKLQTESQTEVICSDLTESRYDSVRLLQSVPMTKYQCNFCEFECLNRVVFDAHLDSRHHHKSFSKNNGHFQEEVVPMNTLNGENYEVVQVFEGADGSLINHPIASEEMHMYNVEDGPTVETPSNEDMEIDLRSLVSTRMGTAASIFPDLNHPNLLSNELDGGQIARIVNGMSVTMLKSDGTPLRPDHQLSIHAKTPKKKLSMRQGVVVHQAVKNETPVSRDTASPSSPPKRKVQGETGPFQCPFCHALFTLEHSLDRHIQKSCQMVLVI